MFGREGVGWSIEELGSKDGSNGVRLLTCRTPRGREEREREERNDKRKDKREKGKRETNIPE